jgi:hypothetical protein
MKRYLPLLLLLLFASPGGDPPPPPPPIETGVFCEEWLHFSDGSTVVADETGALQLREP